MSKQRRSLTTGLNAQVGLGCLNEIEPIYLIAKHHEVQPVQVRAWKTEVAERLP